ncbi:MAG: monooxygenase family protein [Elainellaceae cyanobacterium]
MEYGTYQIDLPAQPDAVVFVNGIVARNRKGFIWMWKNLFRFRDETQSAEGCLQVKAGICGPSEVLMVSYWHDRASLMQFFRGAFHRELMEFVGNHPDALCLYNETYHPTKSGKYIQEPQGLALIYPNRKQGRSPSPSPAQ